MEHDQEIQAGDYVRVRQGKNLGPTVWKVTRLLPQCGCMIQEVNTKNAEQRFDVSLLKKV